MYDYDDEEEVGMASAQGTFPKTLYYQGHNLPQRLLSLHLTDNTDPAKQCVASMEKTLTQTQEKRKFESLTLCAGRETMMVMMMMLNPPRGH